MGEEFNKICASSKVMLSINNQNDIPDYFSDRVFRLLAAKSFVFQLYTPGLENYFEFGKHLIWFTSPEELKILLDQYLRDDMKEMRDAMAEEGYKLVLEKHTWDKSIAKILEVVNE